MGTRRRQMKKCVHYLLSLGSPASGECKSHGNNARLPSVFCTFAPEAATGVTALPDDRQGRRLAQSDREDRR